MRIFIAHSFYRKSLPSGENDVVLSQVQILRSAGHEVELWGKTSPEAIGHIRKLGLGVQVSAGAGGDPTKAINDFCPDIVHVHNLFPNLGMRWIAKTPVPVVMSIHNYRAICANGMLMREGKGCFECVDKSPLEAIRHSCYQDSKLASLSVVGFQRNMRGSLKDSVQRIIFTSEFSRDLLAPKLPGSPHTVIPNYVKDVGFDPRAKTGSSDEYFLVVGRLAREKGVAELLRIWPGQERLLILGDGPERVALQEITPKKNVTFAGFVDNSERDNLMRGARALILPSLTPEVDPVVVAQALSAGTPCIVAANTASAQLVDLSPAILSFHDSESLSGAIEKVRRTDLFEAARGLYEQRWSDTTWLRAFSAMANNVINNS